MPVGVADFRLTLVGETDCNQVVFSHEEVPRSSTRHTCDFCGKSGQPPFTRFFAAGVPPSSTGLLSVMSCFGCMKDAQDHWTEVLGSLATELRIYEPAKSFLELYFSRFEFPIPEHQKE